MTNKEIIAEIEKVKEAVHEQTGSVEKLQALK